MKKYSPEKKTLAIKTYWNFPVLMSLPVNFWRFPENYSLTKKKFTILIAYTIILIMANN